MITDTVKSMMEEQSVLMLKLNKSLALEALCPGVFDGEGRAKSQWRVPAQSDRYWRLAHDKYGDYIYKHCGGRFVVTMASGKIKMFLFEEVPAILGGGSDA